MTAERSPIEQTEHAFAARDMEGLLSGRWPYFVSEAYMAPSTVPTNWDRILLEGIYPFSTSHPDVVPMVRDALVAMTDDPEQLFSALAVVLSHLDHVADGQTSVRIDLAPVIAALKPAIARHRPRLATLRPDWMGPTDRTLWDHVERFARILQQSHGVTLL